MKSVFGIFFIIICVILYTLTSKNKVKNSDPIEYTDKPETTVIKSKSVKWNNKVLVREYNGISDTYVDKGTKAL
jgi:hypothetical protein